MSFGYTGLQVTGNCQNFSGMRIAERPLYLNYEFWADGRNYLVQVIGCYFRPVSSCITMSVCSFV